METRTVLPALPEGLVEAQKLYETYRCNPTENFLLKKEKHYQHSPENYAKYKDKINKYFIESLSASDFIDFILEFTKCGGGIQSLGELNNQKIKNWLHDSNKVGELKTFLLRPFEHGFDLNLWLDESNRNFRGMGIGIFSVYLNRINRKKFPVLNRSTADSLFELYLPINTSRQIKLSYNKLIDFTDKILEWYPNTILDDKTVWDSCFYFISTELEGKPWKVFLSRVINFYNHSSNANSDRYQTHISDEGRNSGNSKYHIRVGRYYRDSVAIKRLKGKENNCCQICGTKILLPENELYCEGHHIKPLGQQGEDRNDNIIIVCPNCHVKLDKFAIKIELEKIKSAHVINTEFFDFHNEHVVKKNHLE